MSRIIIVHGWSGSPERNWMPWLKAELEKRGQTVFVPAMSHSDDPVIERWVPHLAEVVGVPDSDTYLVGHSIGCQAILRYLETISTPIGGAVFVAGWFDLENMESEEEEKIAEPWITRPIDLAKVKTLLPKSTLIISDNDDYGAFDTNRKKFAEFVTKEIVLHNAEHITQNECPEVLAELETMIRF